MVTLRVRDPHNRLTTITVDGRAYQDIWVAHADHPFVTTPCTGGWVVSLCDPSPYTLAIPLIRVSMQDRAARIAAALGRALGASVPRTPKQWLAIQAVLDQFDHPRLYVLTRPWRWDSAGVVRLLDQAPIDPDQPEGAHVACMVPTHALWDEVIAPAITCAADSRGDLRVDGLGSLRIEVGAGYWFRSEGDGVRRVGFAETLAEAIAALRAAREEAA